MSLSEVAIGSAVYATERRQTLVFTDPDPMRIGHIWRWESRLESDSGRLDLWLEEGHIRGGAGEAEERAHDAWCPES